MFDDLDSNGLLSGTLIRQGPVRSEVLGDAERSLGVKSNQVEEVKVRSLHTINSKSDFVIYIRSVNKFCSYFT